MKRKLLLSFITCAFLLSACMSSKKIVYVKDMLSDTSYNAVAAPALRIQKSDRLSILVSATTPELAIPFNQGSGDYQVNDKGSFSRNSTTSSSLNGKGYLVNDQGEIEFPILGSFFVEGLTIDQIRDMIKKRLVKEKFISDPILKIELLNLKISMMGEVKNVGVLEVPDARITLLEAIARSGGLTVNAAANKISVIREEEGVRKVYLHDIASKDIFNSPTYYLQQNDIVYIEPRDADLTPRAQNNLRYVSTGLGLLATIFTILTFLK